MKCRRNILNAWVGRVQFPLKVHRDMIRHTCVFASSGICGSRSAFQCVRGTKRRRTIFGPVQFP
jgi:hypothetical protein